MIGFIHIDPRLNKFFLKVLIDRFVRSRRSRDGQNPILRTSFPFIDVQATHISEGVGNFLPRVHHDQVRGVHELVEVEFVKEKIGLLLVSVEDKGFFPLEWLFVPSDWVWVLRGLR